MIVPFPITPAANLGRGLDYAHPADCFFVRKGRKERKESELEVAAQGLRGPGANRFAASLSFASFASFADKRMPFVSYLREFP